jgi:hypothetical protein
MAGIQPFKYKHARVIESVFSARRHLWLVPIFLFLSLAPALAQINANATISGHVTDPSGAAIPNASVVIANDAAPQPGMQWQPARFSTDHQTLL